VWVLSFKIVAAWMGPEGVGLFGQFRQIVQAATIGATFGGTNAVVQGLSRESELAGRSEFRRTAGRLIGMAGLLIALLTVFLAGPIAWHAFSSRDPGTVEAVRWLGLAILLSVVATYGLAVLNGYRLYRWLAVAQVAGPTALALVLGICFLQDAPRGPWVFACSFGICFGVTAICAAWRVSRVPLTRGANTSTHQGLLPKAFLGFAAAMGAAALSATVSMLLIRSWVIAEGGLASAGLFDAAWTLTFNYVTLFLMACNTLYLPTLTAASSPVAQRSTVLRMVYLVLPVCVVISYSLVGFRLPILHLLYSPAFDGGARLLVILSIAVILRAVSWVYGSLIIATRDSRMLLWSDAGLNILLLASVWSVLHGTRTMENIGWCFVGSNFVYLVFAVEYVCRKNSLMRRRDIWPLVFAASIPLIAVAYTPAVMEGHDEMVAMLLLAGGAIAAATCWHAFRGVRR
jgi:PST family polysaccharide transporter